MRWVIDRDPYHIAILDRGIFDAMAWFQLLNQRGAIEQDDCQKVHQFFMIDKWSGHVDAFDAGTHPLDALRQTLVRELQEEVQVSHPQILRSVGRA